DGKNCTQCHGGTASQATGWITSDIPAEGYVPGETYTINVSVTGTGDKGFEISPQDLSGGLLGTLADGPDVHLVAGNTAVTQDNASSANPAEWQFEWTAPSAGTGTVVFYGAFTVNKPVTKLCTLEVNENTPIYIPETVIPEPVIFPNPANDRFNISYYAASKAGTKIFLISMDGRSILVFESNISNPGMNEVMVSIPPGTPPGIYLIEIANAGYRTRNKLMVR
ncbi:MAG TPA: T9SS type A sorting domain-containing protein, partial [Lentimicrobium sp.]|nr:T9SS type A sorting domain-containing protein [Lentimicrobium sp.]